MRAILLAILLAILSTPAGAAVYYAGAFRSQPILYACNNGLDDDGDGATDYASDPGCASSVDVSELNLGIECDNGLDDDGDGLIDYKTSGGDAECSSRTDTQEAAAPPAAACNDTLDNDGDGSTDYPADTGCTALTDPNELDLGTQCDDGIDNDGDTFIDYKTAGGDPQCSSSSDNTEAAPVTPACSDTVDNDGDGATDYPADPGCGSANDIYEFGSNECDNNLDDDGDTFTDYPDDADCADPSDLTEATDIPTPLCADSLDNDGDGLIDYPADAGCESADDVTETSASLVCDNELDDDGDSTADFRLSGGDPGCGSATDPSETLGTQCDDGLDNDSDGDIDFPDDVNCDSAADDSEAVAAPSDLVADVQAVYTQTASACVAPCTMYVDSRGTVDPSVGDTFRDLVYDIDCGDATAGTWGPSGKSRRYMHEAITGCTYEAAGSYTITLTVTNPVTGATDTDTASVTVSPITSLFANENIHCISNDTDHTGCPSTTTHDNITTTAAAWTACQTATAKTACLFKRGDSFTGAGVALSTASSGSLGVVGAYGTGADPVITAWTGGFTPRSNWALSNLTITGNSASALLGTLGDDVDRYSAHEITGTMLRNCTGQSPSGAEFNDLFTLTDVSCTASPTAGSEISTFIFHRGQRSLLLGVTSDFNYQGEFPFRTVGMDSSAIQHGLFTRPGHSSMGGKGTRNVMQFRAWAQDNGTSDAASGIGPVPRPLDDVIVSDNKLGFYGAPGAGDVVRLVENNAAGSVGANGTGDPQEVTDVIFRRNFFFNTGLLPSTSVMDAGVIQGQGGRITIQNNVIDLQGITGGGSVVRIARQSSNYADCFLCDDDDWTVSGNTVYYDEDINDPLDFCTTLATGTTGHTCDHNLVYRPNDGSVAGDDWIVGSGWTQTGNVRTGTNPLDATPADRGSSVATEFKLSAGSAARNQGTPTRRLDRDFCAATRPNSTSHDAGAWEQGATCP